MINLFLLLKMLAPLLVLLVLIGLAGVILSILKQASRRRHVPRAPQQNPPSPAFQQQPPPFAIPVPEPQVPAPPVYHLRPTILTPAEISFFHVLRSLTPYYIVPKLRLADLFTANHQGAFNKISAKHIDFLLCDPHTMQPILAIELDDSSHNRHDRQERDALVNAIFQQADLPLLRFPVLPTYQPQAVKQLIDSHIDPLHK